MAALSSNTARSVLDPFECLTSNDVCLSSRAGTAFVRPSPHACFERCMPVAACWCWFRTMYALRVVRHRHWYTTIVATWQCFGLVSSVRATRRCCRHVLVNDVADDVVVDRTSGTIWIRDAKLSQLRLLHVICSVWLWSISWMSALLCFNAESGISDLRAMGAAETSIEFCTKPPARLCVMLSCRSCT